VSTSLFKEADLELIEAVADAVTVIRCTPGQHLIQRGTSAAGLFIVHSGECNCLIPDPEQPSQSKNVATKEPGQHFGELSLLDPSSTTAADVVAAAEATVLLITPSAFKNITLTHEKFKGLLLASTPSYREYNFFFHLPAFSDASHDFLLALVPAVKRVTRDAGAVVQSLNEAPAGAYFVEKGQLLATAPGGRPVALHEGSYFGLETLSTADASADPLQQVQAGTDVELLHLPREEAEPLMASFPYLVKVAQAQQLALISSGSAPANLLGATATGGAASEMVDDAAPPAVTHSRRGSVAVAASELPAADIDLLTQRISLMQSSIVAMGREMRARIDAIDSSMGEKLERKDRHQSTSLSNISTRLDQLSAANDHPQRAGGRASSRVSFAPRGASTVTGSDPQRSMVNAAASSRRSSFDGGVG